MSAQLIFKQEIQDISDLVSCQFLGPDDAERLLAMPILKVPSLPNKLRAKTLVYAIPIAKVVNGCKRHPRLNVLFHHSNH
jgi:hypothetical protein